MQTLAPSRSRHPQTQALLDALRLGGWQLASITEDRARLTHPVTRDHLILRADPRIPDRIVNAEKTLETVNLLAASHRGT